MYKNLLIIATATLLASCGNDKDEPQTDDNRIPADFTASITQPRSTLSKWETNDAIGIYMLNAGTTDIAEASSNRRYTTANADGKFTPADADQTIYFPDDETRKVDFVAYYPQTVLTNNIYKVDISNQTAPAVIDLMTAKAASTPGSPLDKNRPTVALGFTHRLSRVEVNVEAGTGFTDADLQGLTITLNGQSLNADFDLLFDKLTPVAKTETLTLNTDADGKTAFAIVLPQGALDARVLTFKMKDNTTYTWDIEPERIFEQGKKTIFNITLAHTGIEVTTNIQAWDTQGTVNGDVEIQQ